MRESVAVAKEVGKEKEFSPTNTIIHRVRDEHEMQLGSLGGVIGNIRRNGDAPSVESIAMQMGGVSAAQRTPALLALQQTHGNRYVQRVVAGIQAKLVVGQPGDKYEQEADRVAEEVMRMPAPLVQRQEIAEGDENQKVGIQAKTLQQAAKGELEVNEDLENRLNRSKHRGTLISKEVRAFLEPCMQFDFGKVRIHTDNEAAQMNRELGARAFTYDKDIYFRAGQYNPGSYDGKRLLAHELTHVVQQNSARQDPEKKLNPLHIHRESSPAVMRDILLKIAKYHGSITDPNIDVQIADHIYDQCNHLNVASAPVNNVNESNTLIDLRGDTTLDFDSGNEVDAVKRRVTATGPGEVPVAYVEDILLNNRRGFSGYTLNGLVAVSNRSIQPHILAHEVGHFLGLGHRGHGSRDLMYENPETITYAQSHPPRLLQSDCRTVRSRIQPKLTVSTPGDMYEQEADRVADAVMRMSEPQAVSSGTLSIQGTCPTCEEDELRRQPVEEEEELLQTKEISGQNAETTPDLESRINVIRGSGQPLPKSARAYFEPRFGYDFSQVQVHIDIEANTLNRALNARAFTTGQDIFFRHGAYNLGSGQGRELLAHELTHVVQQTRGQVTAPIVQRTLEEDIEGVLGHDVQSPESPENRRDTIRRLLEMRLPPDDRRVLERRDVLWRLLELIVDPSEAQHVHDTMRELFTSGLHRSVAAEMLQFLRGIFRPGQAAAEAAESFPDVAFGSIMPGVSGRPLKFNPDYWVVRYKLTHEGEEITFSSDPSELTFPRGLERRYRVAVSRQAARYVLDEPEWANASVTVEIRIGDRGPEAAINDLWWNPESRSEYAFECYIAALLAEFHGIYTFHVDEEKVDQFNSEYQSFSIDLTGDGPGTNLVGRGLRWLTTAESLSRVPSEQRIPLSDSDRFPDVFHRGDWVILYNPFLEDAWENENAVYQGDDQFAGHPIGVFTPERYAEYLYDEGILYHFTRSGYRDPIPPGRGDAIRYVLDHVEIIPRARTRVILPRETR
jgi:hypothetical protein